MKAQIINLSKDNLSKTLIDRKCLTQWVKHISKEIKKYKMPIAELNYNFPKQVRLVFVSESTIQQLNSNFRNKNVSTDILSFPSLVKSTMVESVMFKEQMSKNTHKKTSVDFRHTTNKDHNIENPLLGELVLCLPVILKKQKKINFQFWLYYLILHGMLHLLGWNHGSKSCNSREMYRIQDTIFKKLEKTVLSLK